jgi:L,D-transpeptidase catalytic domain
MSQIGTDQPRRQAQRRAQLALAGASSALLLAALTPLTARAADGTGQPVPTTDPAPAAGVVTQISDEETTTRWAHPYNPARIFAKPTKQSKSVGRLRLMTEDDFPEVYVVLSRMTDVKGNEWARIRIPARPNGKSGWVRRDELGAYHTVHTKLLIDRHKLRATLFKNGRKIFSARVGVGKASTPTPSGHFWIREKFRVSGAPMYGTHAFGTSAYAPTLSDWPNGGVVGLHGTNEPYLIPGRPSHGCIRFKNPDIGRLYKLVPIGTPLEIR